MESELTCKETQSNKLDNLDFSLDNKYNKNSGKIGSRIFFSLQPGYLIEAEEICNKYI
jgi:hypothetical protein